MSLADTVRLALGDWNALAEQATRVRFAVFVEEQRIPAELELDDQDPKCLHCVAWMGDEAVATGRLLPDGHIGRMAVLARLRGSGIGARVLLALVEQARLRGHAAVALSAQVPVLGFYARYGFVPEGDVYDEVGIAHQAMRLTFPH